MNGRAFAALFGVPWLIRPDKLGEIVEVFDARVENRLPELKELLGQFEARRADDAGDGERRAYRMDGDIAVIDLIGTISKRPSLFSSGGASAEGFVRAIRGAAADAKAKAIVVNVDSPGGAVSGIAEAGDAVFALRGKKPIVAVANDCACSAAYWIASAADRLVVAPTAMVGSVGVYIALRNWSEADKKDGYSTRILKAGKHKAAGHPAVPLAAEDAAAIQETVDRYYALFVAAVARNRGLAVDVVRDTLADGREWIGAQAVELGAADEVGTLDDTIARLNAGTFFSGGTTVAENVPAVAGESANSGPAATPPTQTAPAPAAIPPAAPAVATTPQTPTPNADAIRQEAIAAERGRVNEIHALVGISRLPAEKRRALADEAITKGFTPAQTSQAIAEALKVADVAVGDAGGTPPIQGAGDPIAADAKNHEAVYAKHGVDAKAAAEWAKAAESGAPLMDIPSLFKPKA